MLLFEQRSKDTLLMTVLPKGACLVRAYRNGIVFEMAAWGLDCGFPDAHMVILVRWVTTHVAMNECMYN